tara:strand:- start:288 stop:1073 length:786 start_codon:yes stop_codon:yes gene_type:complete
MQKKLTVKDILDSKGKSKLAEVYTHYAYEAEACELAGIDMIISSENNDVISIRNAAPNTFFTVGLQYGIHLNEYEIINKAFNHLKNGADAIYCPQSEKYIKALSDEGIPVVGHTGFIPYKSTFYGGFRAFGKTSKEANKIFDQTKRIQDAGAFAIEIEIVPNKVGEFISKNFEIFVIGMGSGQGCDAQYLFSEDILGYNKGHIPRHSKVYTNLSEDYGKIKKKSIQAFKEFKSEINNKIYPESKHDIKIMDEEFKTFLQNK